MDFHLVQFDFTMSHSFILNKKVIIILKGLGEANECGGVNFSCRVGQHRPLLPVWQVVNYFWAKNKTMS